MTSLVMILAYLCGEDRKGIFIFVFISGDINRILAEDAVNVPRNEEDATKYCDAGTDSEWMPALTSYVDNWQRKAKIDTKLEQSRRYLSEK